MTETIFENQFYLTIIQINQLEKKLDFIRSFNFFWSRFDSLADLFDNDKAWVLKMEFSTDLLPLVSFSLGLFFIITFCLVFSILLQKSCYMYGYD